MPPDIPPPRRPPAGAEPVPDLCDGITITAERLRHAVRAVAAQGRWSPAAISPSWRRDALASAITGHASELILRTLAERAMQLGTMPSLQAQLASSADASAGPGQPGARSPATGTPSPPASTSARTSAPSPQNSRTSSCGPDGSPTATPAGRPPARRQPGPRPGRPRRHYSATSRPCWPPFTTPPTPSAAPPTTTPRQSADQPPTTSSTCPPACCRCPSFGMSVLASLVVSGDGIAKPRRRVLAGLWGSGCRRGAHSVVTSVTAARAEDSSAMALPAVNAASRAATAMLLTARG